MRSAPLLATFLLVVPVPAQRQLTTIGRFVDPEGEPIASATVTFATSPLRVHDAFAPATVVTATTDEEGRFRTSLAVGKAHSAWAVGPSEEGLRWRSKVVEGVIAGNVLEFVAATRTEDAPLRCNGVASLAGKAPHTAVVRIDARHSPRFVVSIGADGTVELPPLPDAALCVQVEDAAGRVVVVNPSVTGRELTCAEPRRFQFIVRSEDGTPLPGARVAIVEPILLGSAPEPFTEPRMDSVWIESEPTGDDGRTSIVVHGASGPFFAFAEAHDLSVTGRAAGTWVQDGILLAASPHPKGGPEVIEFRLRRAKPLRGRLRRGAQPLSGVGVQVLTRVWMEREDAGRITATWLDLTRTAHTGPDGTFTFASLAKNTTYLQFAVAPVGDHPVLMALRTSVPAEPLDLDLAAWPVLTVQLLAEGTMPPGDARLVVLPTIETVLDPDPVVLSADRAGRVRVRLEPGGWFVFATDGSGYAMELLETDVTPVDRIELPFVPLARLRGVLLDADGVPLHDRGFTFGTVEQGGAAAGGDLLARLRRRYAPLLNRGLTTHVRTDRLGRFELRFVEADGITMEGTTTGEPSAGVTLKPGEDVELRAR